MWPLMTRGAITQERSCGWIADMPDLALCSAFGETPEAALREVMIAKEAWLAAARALGRPIPEPRYRPAIDQTA